MKMYAADQPLARPLWVIARDISKNWPKVNYAAKPYLDAMSKLEGILDNYYADSAKDVVLYFLANASSWRGEEAKRIKAELKNMAGIK
jgi:hypothetical protein